jgi:hypothetical protein
MKWSSHDSRFLQSFTLQYWTSIAKGKSFFAMGESGETTSVAETLDEKFH